MVSAAVFQKAEYVIRCVRGNNRIFGGLQVIACGDFKQLPPVPDPLHLDPGDYCFLAEEFKLAFPHKIILTKVKRQDEPQLVKAVRELCDGEPSAETNILLKSLDRPLKNNDAKPVMLFGVNFDVDFMNQDKLDAMQGLPKIYRAVDSGEKELLIKSQAPKILSLKVGAPVMLLKNLTSTLCNGTQGKVQSLTDGDPVINFNEKLYNIKRTSFEIYDTKQNKLRASRYQYPLKLAFAVTVHKAQGQTLPYLDVDCHGFFAPGQLGVAIGHAVSIENLRVRNYSSEYANIKHLPHVYDFYTQCTDEDVLFDDLSCCRPTIQEGDRDPGYVHYKHN